MGLRESGKNGRTGRRGGKGNCSQNVIDKREKKCQIKIKPKEKSGPRVVS